MDQILNQKWMIMGKKNIIKSKWPNMKDKSEKMNLSK